MATRKKPVLNAAQKKTAGQMIAALAAGFLPIASYVIAHVEAPTNPYLYALVAAALLFSAPTLAGWATKWCKSKYKAWGFTVLLEGVMVLSTIPALALSGLAILVAINCHAAWLAAATKPQRIREAKPKKM